MDLELSGNYKISKISEGWPLGSHPAHLGQVARWRNFKRQVAKPTRPTRQSRHLALFVLPSTWQPACVKKIPRHCVWRQQDLVIAMMTCYPAFKGCSAPGGLCARWAPDRQVGCGNIVSNGAPGGVDARWARWALTPGGPGGRARWPPGGFQVASKGALGVLGRSCSSICASTGQDARAGLSIGCLAIVAGSSC